MVSPIQSPLATINLQFNGRRVRFVGTADRPAWIAVDVGDLLDIQNIRQAVADFDDEERGVCTTYTGNAKQTLITLYEAGLYRLISNSRKPVAKQFRKWVFGEVLPSIRKYGQYPPPENATYQMTLKPYTSRVSWLWQVRKQIPQGYWCIFIEGAEILIGAEQIFGPANLEMHQYDLLDGSMGKHWSGYRTSHPWQGEPVRYRYTFPDGDPRGTVTPWAYPMRELEHFKDWLHTDYSTVHMPQYIKRKYGAVEYRRALPILSSMGILTSAK